MTNNMVSDMESIFLVIVTLITLFLIHALIDVFKDEEHLISHETKKKLKIRIKRKRKKKKKKGKHHYG
jgi:hypothetical protein|nr:MAG TPA: hypothetical protein [Caudoviricetes sp.]